MPKKKEIPNGVNNEYNFWGGLVGAREKVGSNARNDLYCVWVGVGDFPGPCAGFKSDRRSLLGRIWAHHRRAVFVKSLIHWMGSNSQYKRLAIFTSYTLCWSVGWFVYLVRHDMEIRLLWQSLLVRVGLRVGLYGQQHWDSWNGSSELASAGSAWGGLGESIISGKQSIMETVIELLLKSGNWGAFAFGIFGLMITGILGFMLRRPLMKQTVFNEGFKTVQEGYENLLSAKDRHIERLELQVEAQNNYESTLIMKLRECEERHLRRDREG